MRHSIVHLRHAVDLFVEVREQAETRVLATVSANEEQVAIALRERIVAAAGSEVLARTLRVAENAGRRLKNREAAMDDLERGTFVLPEEPSPPYRPSADEASREEGGVEIDQAAHAREQVTFLASQIADLVLAPRETTIVEAVDLLARAMPETLEPLSSPADDSPAPC